MTTGDKVFLLAKMPNDQIFSEKTDQSPVIEIDKAQTFQTIDGFGYTLTGGSAYLIHQKLSEAQQDELLKELFLRDETGIGVSYLRVSIGASDLDEFVYSYDDMPVRKTDIALQGFSLAYDTLYLIPILKKILAINPQLEIMGSPWSAPAWMKTNQSPIGGSLKPEYYKTYARYFVRYIQAMANADILIDAITLQNEPEHPGNNPSMLMTAENQADFVKNHLGPAFEEAALETKIIIYDHNCDHPEYPITVLNDPGAKKYIDGSAFHLYLGEIEALSEVHTAHPDRNLYFTEQWTSGKGDFAGDLRWHVKNLIVGATRNWSRTVIEWNLAADPEFNPHTDQGGCTLCQGALTIGDTVTRNVSYYIIAHASKFVEPGSTRIASNIIDGLYNVAFLTPSGKTVLIVVNDNEEEKAFNIKYEGQMVGTVLPAGAVGTFVW
ncbi:MAG: glucosylceramidase [Saprospiraceae bacterium]|nr:MAG: glucosylceramidase [Saprospiraceae bacterium]